jgi:hypothetical protein
MGSGVYGDMLSSFAELTDDYVIFKLPARIGAGYGERYDVRTVRGYLSRNIGGRMGVEGEIRVENDEATFFEEDTSEDGQGNIRQGDYVEDGIDLFVFNHDDRFTREGGFLIHRLQLVPAFTGKQEPDQSVDLAADFG